MTLNRWGALFGTLAAALLIAAVLISGDTPDGDASDEEWIDYVEEDETAVLVRAYLLVAASLSLIALYGFGLRPHLGDAEPVDRSFASVGAGATLLGAGSFTVGGLVGAAVGAAHLFGDVPIDPSLARLFDNLFYGALLVPGAVSMGALMGVVAIQTWRHRAFPRWVFWVSIVAIVCMAASLIFLPLALLPIWLIAISIAILRTGETPTANASTRTT